MTDDQTPAREAGDEVVQTEVEQTEAPEAVESTQGQDNHQPAEVESEAQEGEAETEEKSKSAERRERRKAQQEALRQKTEQAEREAREAQQRLEAAQLAASNLKEPTLEDFGGDYDRFNAGLAAFYAVSGIEKREAERLQAEATERAAQAAQAKQMQIQEAAQNWEAQRAEAPAKYPDFEAVVSRPDNPIMQPHNAEFGTMVAGSDVAADLAYLLSKDTALAQQIAALPPAAMGREIGKLEAQLSAPKPKTTTTAPDPINPVRGTKATASKNPADMTPEEFAKWRDGGGTF